MLTIGDLRKAMADLPDDSPVLVRLDDGAEFAAEVNLSHRANDDRYAQNKVFLILTGDFSP